MQGDHGACRREALPRISCLIPREIVGCGQCDKPVSAVELTQLDEGSVDNVDGLVGVARDGLEDLGDLLPSVRSELSEHGQGVDPVVDGELRTVQDVAQGGQLLRCQGLVRDVDIGPVGDSGSDREEVIIEEFPFDLALSLAANMADWRLAQNNWGSAVLGAVPPAMLAAQLLVLHKHDSGQPRRPAPRTTRPVRSRVRRAPGPKPEVPDADLLTQLRKAEETQGHPLSKRQIMKRYRVGDPRARRLLKQLHPATPVHTNGAALR